MPTIVFEIAAIAIAIYFLVAFGLVASQGAAYMPPDGEPGLMFGDMLGQDLSGLPPTIAFAARDGTALHYRRYECDTAPDRVVILVHGSAWHGMQFHAMATALSGRGLATVIVPDMRGHGANPARRGDCGHIGQLEEDMADLIGHVGEGSGATQIVLGGHSSGGGFVVRFAGGQFGDRADAFLLLAPFLKHDAPTTRRNAGGWARPAVRRIIGLAMLNRGGIAAFNHLPVISFAMPRAVMEGPYGYTATNVYSYRLHVSFGPRPDYGRDLGAITRPLLVLAGEADESFVAEEFEPVISAHSRTGSYHVLPGVNHLGVVSDDRALAIVADWLRVLPKTRSG